MKQARFLLVLIILVTGNSSSGQMITGLNKDSLKRVTASMAEDTNKVENYILLGQQYESNIPDSAVYYYKQANQLSTRLNYPSGIIRYVNNYTAVLNMQGKYDESLKLHQQALALCDKYDLNDLRVKSLLNIGVVYQLKEDYRTAADHYLKYLPVLERTAGAQQLSTVYGNLSGLFRDLNQPQKAVGYARQSVQYAEKSKDPYTIGRAYNNLSNTLQKTGSLKEREQYLVKALGIARQLNDIDLQETSLINLADLYSQSASPDKYIALYRTALPLADSLGDPYGKSLALHGIALGLFMKKQYQQAAQQALEALSYSRRNEQQESESKVLLLLSDIQIALGNLSLSTRYRNEYDSVYASIVNADLVKNVQELETKYEVEKKQSQILKQDLLLEQKNREALRQRTWLWISLAGTGLMVFLLFWGYRFYRQRQQLNKRELEALQAEQENIRLKSLIEGQVQERQRISQELHDDVGSGLTSMLFLSRAIQGQEDVVGRLRQTAASLVQRMNEIIWIMNHENDTIESMVAYMRLHIAEALDNAGIDYHFTVTDPLPERPLSQEFRRAVYLCAKEAAHNSIKHAGASRVDIDIKINDRMMVTITDHGKGMDAKKITGLGNGLKNMRRRMEGIGGGFDIQSTGQGVQVTLDAPLPV